MEITLRLVHLECWDEVYFPLKTSLSRKIFLFENTRGSLRLAHWGGGIKRDTNSFILNWEASQRE